MAHIAIICTTPDEFQREVSKRSLNGILVSQTKKQLEFKFNGKTSLFRMVQINPYKPGVAAAIKRQTHGLEFDKYYVSEMEVDCRYDIMKGMKFRMVDDKIKI